MQFWAKSQRVFGGLIALARANTTWRKYTDMIEKAFPKQPQIGDQFKIDLPLNED
jgi:hypothetical protein